MKWRSHVSKYTYRTSSFRLQFYPHGNSITCIEWLRQCLISYIQFEKKWYESAKTRVNEPEQ